MTNDSLTYVGAGYRCRMYVTLSEELAREFCTMFSTVYGAFYYEGDLLTENARWNGHRFFTVCLPN